MSSSFAVSRAESGSAGAVKAVSVISTGTVQIRPEHPYGSRKPLYWWLLTSRQWTPPRPVNVPPTEVERRVPRCVNSISPSLSFFPMIVLGKISRYH